MAFIAEETGAVLAGTEPPRGASGLRRVLRVARELPALSLAILVPFLLLAIFANWIAPYDPT